MILSRAMKDILDTANSLFCRREKRERKRWINWWNEESSGWWESYARALSYECWDLGLMNYFPFYRGYCQFSSVIAFREIGLYNNSSRAIIECVIATVNNVIMSNRIGPCKCYSRAQNEHIIAIISWTLKQSNIVANIKANMNCAE